MKKLLYTDDIKETVEAVKDVELLKNRTIFITGANGLIGSFIVDVVMWLNENKGFDTTLVVNSRSEEKLKKRFDQYIDDNNFKYYIGDINEPISYKGKVDYIINCASNTHPKQYANDPIGTIVTNIGGTANVLDFAVKAKAEKVIYLSSVEIYGENVNNIDRFKENEMGYIDCNSLRAGYNEAKRCGEALCQAYIEKKGLDISILRLPRTYGPTIKADDTKALSQFISRGMSGEDIILKSKGDQYFSYLYVADVASGILRCLIAGKNGEVYNLGNIESDIRLKDLARLTADLTGVKVKFDLPDENEAKGYSKATIARLNYDKAVKELNWQPKYSIKDGIDKTIRALRA